MGRAGRIFPLLPARTCVSPRPVQECRTPFQDQRWACRLLQIQSVRGIVFSQRRKFCFLTWEGGIYACRALALPELMPLLEGKGKEAAFSESRARPGPSPTLVLSSDTFRGLQTPQHVAPRWERVREKPGHVLGSHEQPPRETKDKTQVQKK